MAVTPLHRTEAPLAGSWARDPDPWGPRLLWIALALGLLRFFHLGTWSLWLDEAFTLADSEHRSGLANPLGYSLFDFFYGLSGSRPSEAWMRFPAALFGWLTIPATYWAFRPLVGRRVAGVAALVVALSTWQLYWSQNARFYTLAQLLTTLGGGLFLRSLWAGSTGRAGLGIAVAGAAALAHPSAVLLLVPLMAAPWVAFWASRLPRGGEVPWTLLSIVLFGGALFGAGWAIEVWATWSEQKGQSSTLHLVVTTGYYLTPTVGLAMVLGAVRILRDRAHGGFFVLLVCLGGLTVAFLASLFVRVSAQYVFVLLPWLALLAGSAFGRSTPEANAGPGLGVTALGLVLMLAPNVGEQALYFGLRHGDRPRWKEAYRYVFDQRAEEDLILGMDAPVGVYYWDPHTTDLRRWSNITWLDTWRLDHVFDWARFPRTTWFILNHEQLYDWTPEQREEILSVLEQDCELMESFTVPLIPRDLDVHVYRRGPVGKTVDAAAGE